MGFKKGQSGNPKGRKPGVPNKATAEVKALALEHTPQVIERLAYLALKAESEQAQVSACRELLDRAHGKPAQAVTGPEGESLVPLVTRVIHQFTDDASDGE
jgi:hypothetical protein